MIYKPADNINYDKAKKYIWFYKIGRLKYYYYFIYGDKWIYETGFTKKQVLPHNSSFLKIKLTGIGKMLLVELKRYFEQKLSNFKSSKYIYFLHHQDNSNNIKSKIYKFLIKKVKRGNVTTYKRLARIFNIHPRYVGSIMRNNRAPLLIPCHRVIKTDGTYGGYMGKYISIKKFLLNIERYQR